MLVLYPDVVDYVEDVVDIENRSRDSVESVGMPTPGVVIGSAVVGFDIVEFGVVIAPVAIAPVGFDVVGFDIVGRVAVPLAPAVCVVVLVLVDNVPHVVLDIAAAVNISDADLTAGPDRSLAA